MLRKIFYSLRGLAVVLAFLAAASCVRAQQVTLPLWPNGTPENPGVSAAGQ